MAIAPPAAYFGIGHPITLTESLPGTKQKGAGEENMDDIESTKIRVDRLEKSVDLLSEKNAKVEIEQALIDEKVNCILTTLNEVKKTVNNLQLAPVKRWDILVGSAISSFISIITGILIGKLLL